MYGIRTLALALVTLVTLSAAEARAQYYGAVVKNNSGITVTYQYKLNNGAWNNLTLLPGQSHQFNFRTPVTGKAEVYVRFDCVLGDGKVTFHTQRLCMWGMNTPANGWLHVFIKTNSGKNLHLQP